MCFDCFLLVLDVQISIGTKYLSLWPKHWAQQKEYFKVCKSLSNFCFAFIFNFQEFHLQERFCLVGQQCGARRPINAIVKLTSHQLFTCPQQSHLSFQILRWLFAVSGVKFLTPQCKLILHTKNGLQAIKIIHR